MSKSQQIPVGPRMEAESFNTLQNIKAFHRRTPVFHRKSHPPNYPSVTQLALNDNHFSQSVPAMFSPRCSKPGPAQASCCDATGLTKGSVSAHASAAPHTSDVFSAPSSSSPSPSTAKSRYSPNTTLATKSVSTVMPVSTLMSKASSPSSPSTQMVG